MCEINYILMKKILIFLFLVTLFFGCIQTYEEVEEPFTPEFTFLITIDGARPDYIEKLDTNTIDYLINEHNAKYSLNSETVCPSITTSAHASLFTGVEPEVHGYYNPGDDVNSKTIFEVFEENGYETLLLDGKGGRIKGLERGVSSFMGNKNYYDDKETDLEIIKDFLDAFEAYRPTFSFILLPEVDRMGHWHGHNSDEYSEAIIKADNAIGVLVTYLKENDLFENSSIVITSDHGMTNHDHGACFITDIKIPIIKYGKGFTQGPCPDQSIKDIAKEILNIYDLNFN